MSKIFDKLERIKMESQSLEEFTLKCIVYYESLPYQWERDRFKDLLVYGEEVLRKPKQEIVGQMRMNLKEEGGE